MWLIFRRILASFINSVIALILIIIFCFLIGATLWFFPIRSYLNMNFVFLIFAVAYATLGNLGKGGVPPIGGRIAGIKLVTTTASDTPSFFQILIRNILYIIAPAMILTASNLMPNIFDIENTGIYFGIITIAFIIMFFSMLLVPISIVVGQGKKGLHDAVCKLAVSKRSSNEKSDITIKYIFYQSLIWAFLISLILTFIVHTTLFGFGVQSFIYPGTNRDSQIAELKQLVSKFDSAFPVTPIKYRKYAVQEGFQWWIDLTNIPIYQRLEIAKEIGLKDPDRLDLLGYGLKDSQLFYPIKLIDMDRNLSKKIPEGTYIFSLFLFVDNNIFYNQENLNLIKKYFIEKMLEFNLARENKVWQIKIIRQIKVGVVTLGFFDEIYITSDGKLWRDESTIYSSHPSMICKIYPSSLFTDTFLTNVDLQ